MPEALQLVAGGCSVAKTTGNGTEKFRHPGRDGSRHVTVFIPNETDCPFANNFWHPLPGCPRRVVLTRWFPLRSNHRLPAAMPPA